MMKGGILQRFLFVVLLFVGFHRSLARPVVRNIQSTHEFERLLEKHATETGLPVVVDFYSDSCGPCRMMAPIFKKVAADYMDKAVFVKIDTATQYELSSRYQVRSLPTFSFFVNGQVVETQLGGIGEGPLRQYTDSAIRQAELENVVLTLEALQTYYQQQDPNKSVAEIQSVHKKCVELTARNFKKRTMSECMGSAATQLIRKLRKKYKTAPKTVPRFSAADRKKSSDSSSSGSSSSSSSSTNKDNRKARDSTAGTSNKPNLNLATLDELKAELERRLDEIRDAQVEQEDFDEDEANPDVHTWHPTAYPERVVIIGGGPAGMAAAIYAARAGLQPLVIAPSMGGQLQGKGVTVENYPAVVNVTGPAVIAVMRQQAAHFGAVFEDDFVTQIEVRAPTAANEKPQPFVLHTNSSTTAPIRTHTIIVATGADAVWLNVTGEYELRGAGVSSCAVCDGFLYAGDNHVVVVGGGDAAAEDALLLARTSQKVTLIHRRNELRASKILQDRLFQHPHITIQWDSVVQEIVGTPVQTFDSANDNKDTTEIDLDDPSTAAAQNKVVSGVWIKNVVTGEVNKLECDAVFVAIGHTPNTAFLRGVVEFNPQYPGYIHIASPGSTHTSVPGIFAAGDVSDPVYRQAITSAGSGAAAALDAERYLSEHGLGNEAAELEAELMAEFLTNDGASFASASAAEHTTYNVYEEAGGKRPPGLMRESLSASSGGEL